jgi:hypothetical protein
MYEDLEALYNFVVLFTECDSKQKEDKEDKEDNNHIHIHIDNDILFPIYFMDEIFYIHKNIDYDSFCILLHKVNFPKIFQSYNINVHHIYNLFISNDITILDPFEVTLHLVAIGIYFGIWQVHTPKLHNKELCNYLSSFDIIIEYNV